MNINFCFSHCWCFQKFWRFIDKEQIYTKIREEAWLICYNSKFEANSKSKAQQLRRHWPWYCWWFRNPANQLRLVVYPIIYKVLYIPGGCLGFLPSTICIWTEWMLNQKNVVTPTFQHWPKFHALLFMRERTWDQSFEGWIFCGLRLGQPVQPRNSVLPRKMTFPLRSKMGFYCQLSY